MPVMLSDRVAAADGLDPADAATVRLLVQTWQDHVAKNRLRDQYYAGHVGVKDLGVSISPAMMRKIRPRCDWAAKCVDWWADRVRFEGVTCSDEGDGDVLSRVLAQNDAKNLMRMVSSAALRHSCAFLTVTRGDQDEPSTIVSGYPATASSALWNPAKKRVDAALVVVATRHARGSSTEWPTLCWALTDRDMIVLTETRAGWVASYEAHGMGRAPVVPVVYHPTLSRPFGRSRITGTVRGLVDDAQRELANMTVAAAFSSAPQKYLLGADKEAAEKIASSPFGAYIGSVFATTQSRNGTTPQYGQLAQMSMEPHVQYMRTLAASFSGATGVPLSSLGVVADNPSSADAIRAAKEDAVVDIQSFVDGCKRAVGDVCRMALASERGTTFADQAGAEMAVEYANPATPSIVSQSDAIVKQVGAFPWMSDSDVPLRELGYTDEQVAQLRSDRRKSQALSGAGTILSAGGGSNGSDIKRGPTPLSEASAPDAG